MEKLSIDQNVITVPREENKKGRYGPYQDTRKKVFVKNVILVQNTPNILMCFILMAI